MKVSKYISFGEIDNNGTPSAYDKQSVLTFLKQHPGQRIEITYKVIKDTSGTYQQMRYYRGVIVPNLKMGLRNIGYAFNHDQVHDFMRQRSGIGVDYIDVRKDTFQNIESTGDFDKESWSDYIEECIRFAAEELIMVIPEPIYERYDLTKK